MNQADQRIAPLSLRQNFVLVLVGRGIYAACQWGLLSVCAKLGSADLLGRYALGVAVCTPIFMLANLKLAQVLVTDASDEHGFDDYIRLRFMTTVAAMLVICAVVFAAGYAPTTLATILAIGFGQAVLVFREIFLARAQKAQRMDRLAYSNALLGVLGLSAFAIVFWLTRSLIAAIVALAFMRLAVTVGVDAPCARQIEFAQPRDHASAARHSLIRLAYLCIPLGIVGMLMSFTASVPRYEVERQLGEASLGYFAALASLPMVGNILMEGLAKATSPLLAKYYIENRHAYARLTAKLAAAGIVIGAAALTLSYLIGKPVLTICFAEEYAEHHGTFMWLIAGGALMYLWCCVETSLTAARFFRIQVPIAAAAAATALATAWVLIPQFGLNGAAFAWMSGNAVAFLGIGAAVVYATLRPPPKPPNSNQGATDNASMSSDPKTEP